MHNRKIFFIIIIFVNAFLLSGQVSYATSPGQGLFEASYYRNEGPFVSVPSTVAAFAIFPSALFVGIGTGIAGGIIGIPALPFIDSKEYLCLFVGWPGFVAAHLVSIPFSHTVGFPFYFVKKAFYDFPVWVYGKSTGSER